MHRIGRITVLIALGVFLSFGLSAGTVGPVCNNCFGGIFGLTGYDREVVDGVSSPVGYDTWRIFYDINLEGFTGPDDYFISQVAVKLVGGPNSFESVTLNTTASSANIGSWDTPIVLNSNLGSGCGGGGKGWFCIGGGNLLGADKEVYRLAFDVVFKEGTMISDASIQANWDPPTGVLLSEKVGVPEGASGELSLLLGGLGGLLMWRRRLSMQ